MSSNKIKLSFSVAFAAGLVLSSSLHVTRAAPLDLSHTPLFLKTGVAPNLILTLDDSGSMDRDYVPDGLGADDNDLAFHSYRFNGMAYNPQVTYKPPVDANGTPLSTRFEDAWDDGFVRTSRTDLRSRYPQPGWSRGPAFYSVWDASNAGCNGTPSDNDCYDKVVVPPDQRQNFANWYSFYRTRRLATISGATLAFAGFGSSIRLGWQRINDDGLAAGVRPFEGAHRDAFYDWVMDLPARGGTPLRRATQRAGEYFQTAEPYLNAHDDANSDMAACRQSYHILMTDGVWNGQLDDYPGNVDNRSHTLPDGKTYTPRPPFQDRAADTIADLAFQFWLNDLQPDLDDEVPAYFPHQEGSADDNYWNPRNNPATWQHMVNFTVSFGLSSSLQDPRWGGNTYGGDYNALAAGTKAWPEAKYEVDWLGNGHPDNVYDLWHAAINSRGQFFSADDPQSLAAAFETILNRVSNRNSSASSAALESGSIAGSDAIYIARFNSEDWTGQLLAYTLNDDGSIGDIRWDAGCALDGGTCASDLRNYTGKHAGNRRIVTWRADQEQGVVFSWSALSEAQRHALNKNAQGADLVDYLRGNRSKEIANTNGVFRNRDSLLGDIISASPVYVGPPRRFYPNAWPGESAPENAASASYAAFKQTHAGRAGIVYVGANDGMLHAFSAATGEELFAYIPGAVFDRLAELGSPEYTHRYYVDATPTEADAFFDGRWHSVLVGGLGGGGQAVYALDITQAPTGLTSESSIAEKVLWEFGDTDDADLGYTFSRPQVVRLHNGKWAAVFGNGYNNTEVDGAQSSSGNAVLYIVDMANGSLIRKIDTGVGTASDPTDASRPNGLATVAPADVNGDGIVDFVYGGDLFGNLWKFDLSATSPESWAISHNKPLFKAVHGEGAAAYHQPITTQPSIRRHPTGRGYLIVFGTGKYLETTDAAPKSTVESVYGIWDRDLAAPDDISRSKLLAQAIEAELNVHDRDWRIVSNEPISWYGDGDADPEQSHFGWYLDLVVQGKQPAGEMQVTDTLISGDRLLFTTLIPNDDPCSQGGESWLMALDYRDGSRIDEISIFDVDGKDGFNRDDYVRPGAGEEPVPVSGAKSQTGVLQQPTLGAGDGSDIAYLGPGTHGEGSECKGQDCETINRTPALWNRQSWRQLR